MSSNLLSTLEVLQLNGCIPGTAAYSSGRRLILQTNTVIIITTVGYDYSEHQFVHAILLGLE
jgi:hypothetical protein